MYCEPGASGKQYRGNMGVAAVFTGIFKNGRQTAGFFEKIWVLGLEKYDELEGIGWEWQSVDGCMIKAPLARESVGHNPTDRGKNGDKTKRLNR